MPAPPLTRSPETPTTRRINNVLIALGIVVLGYITTLDLTLKFRSFTAPNWTPVPCTIISSKIQYDYNTKRQINVPYAEVIYDYEFNGQPRRSSAYEVSSLPPRDADAAPAVAAHPAGQRTTCYVN